MILRCVQVINPQMVLPFSKALSTGDVHGAHLLHSRDDKGRELHRFIRTNSRNQPALQEQTVASVNLKHCLHRKVPVRPNRLFRYRTAYCRHLIGQTDSASFWTDGLRVKDTEGANEGMERRGEVH